MPPKQKPASAPRRYYYRKRYVSGKGDYKTALKKVYNYAKQNIPKGTLASVGSKVAGPYGAMAGALIAKLTGLGEYKSNADLVKYNALFKAGQNEGNAVQIPQFQRNKHGVQIVHREYIGDIICGTGTPSAFTIGDYDINPGLSAVFPWLSQIAQNFETYQFHGLVFEAKSLCTDNTATFAGLGSVIMACQYNAANPVFINKFQMENYEGAISAKPSQSMLLGVECDARDLPESHLYIRSGSLAANQDVKTYDLGQMQIATVGMPVASQQICELWVSYVVDLFQPKIYAGQLGYGINWFHQYSSTSVSVTNYFGTDYATKSSNSSSTMNLTLGQTTITFPNNIVTGAYAIIYAWTGTGGTPAFPTITATSNCSDLSVFKNNADSFITSYISAQGEMPQIKFISITGPGAVVTMSGGTAPGTLTSVDLYVMQIPANVN